MIHINYIYENNDLEVNLYLHLLEPAGQGYY
jgi:hypothetical protein